MLNVVLQFISLFSKSKFVSVFFLFDFFSYFFRFFVFPWVLGGCIIFIQYSGSNLFGLVWLDKEG